MNVVGKGEGSIVPRNKEAYSEPCQISKMFHFRSLCEKCPNAEFLLVRISSF